MQVLSESPDGVSGVHQTDTGSSSVQVLGLRPLSQSPRRHPVQLLPAMCPQTFVLGQGVIRVMPTELIRLKQTEI